MTSSDERALAIRALLLSRIIKNIIPKFLSDDCRSYL